ncbi:MAG: hypothetical protein EA400_11285 [Chromatiaceae bacterium]|nr:MAG: hypothetical protein EA400_11285 [Chromatiaceae bacterium]
MDQQHLPSARHPAPSALPDGVGLAWFWLTAATLGWLLLALSVRLHAVHWVLRFIDAAALAAGETSIPPP